MRLANQQLRIIIIIVCSVILFTGPIGAGFLFPLSSVGYITGYEGAKPRFSGVQWRTTDGTKWVQSSTLLWDTTFTYDKDKRGEGYPPIAGEMTAVFIPQESVGKQISKFSSGADITSWLLGATNIKNPIRYYEWDLTDSSGNQVLYRMEEWQLKHYFSISSEPTGSEIPRCYGPPCTDRNSIKDLQVWIELDISPIWYFEGTDTTYFAIAELRISDIMLGGKLNNEYENEYNSELRVLPSSAHSILPLYYGLYGTESNRADKTAYTFQDRLLNPDLFTDKVYTYFTLQDFGVSVWSPWTFGTVWRADVVTVGLDVHMFVIGEWVVQDIQEIPEEYGREAKTGSIGTGSLAGIIAEILRNPTFQIWSLIALACIILIVLSIFAPSVLYAIFGIAKSRGKRSRQKR